MKIRTINKQYTQEGRYFNLHHYQTSLGNDVTSIFPELLLFQYESSSSFCGIWITPQMEWEEVISLDWFTQWWLTTDLNAATKPSLWVLLLFCSVSRTNMYWPVLHTQGTLTSILISSTMCVSYPVAKCMPHHTAQAHIQSTKIHSHFYFILVQTVNFSHSFSFSCKNVTFIF